MQSQSVAPLNICMRFVISQFESLQLIDLKFRSKIPQMSKIWKKFAKNLKTYLLRSLELAEYPNEIINLDHCV